MTELRTLKELTKDELQAAILAVVSETGWCESARLPSAAASLRGASFQDEHSVGVRAGHWTAFRNAQTSFSNRIRTYADQLAADGQLVKVSPGQTRPEGYKAGQFAYYYIPGKHAELAAAREEELAGREAENARWQRVTEVLGTAGFELDGGTMSLADWERLAGLLEALGGERQR